jgi:serine/threonine-protein kinase RsbW
VTQVTFHLPPARGSAPKARQRLRTAMGTWGDESSRGDAELLLTEVVTNGVLHARSPMEVHLSVERDLLRAEVSDGSPLAPVGREPDEFGGRGLLILDALASSWGVSGDASAGKTVWFELADSASLS